MCNAFHSFDTFRQEHIAWVDPTAAMTMMSRDECAVDKELQLHEVLRQLKSSHELPGGMAWPCRHLRRDTPRVVVPWVDGGHWFAVFFDRVNLNGDAYDLEINIADSNLLLEARPSRREYLRIIWNVICCSPGIHWRRPHTTTWRWRRFIQQSNRSDCGPLTAFNCGRALIA